MKDFLMLDNEYFKKLQEWYGDFLKDYGVDVLYIDREDEKVFAVAYLLINKKHMGEVEIARVFKIENKIEISIDYSQ